MGITIEELKRRIEIRERQLAQFGYAADPSIRSNIEVMKGVVHSIERINLHRQALGTLLKQRDQFGSAYVPEHIESSIAFRRMEIQQLRKACEAQGYHIDEASVDIDNSVDPMDIVREKLYDVKDCIRAYDHKMALQLLEDILNIIG